MALVPLSLGRTIAGGLAAAALVVVGSPGGAASQTAPARVLTIDLAQPGAPLNHDLVGFGLHDGGAPISSIAPLRPHLVRIDASLEHVSTGPGAPLRLEGLQARVDAVRAIGGEPLVILSYLPAWLGEANAGGRDPTRVAPGDLDAWQAVVHDVVLALATAPQPARRFEAWNEPDVPVFWQDTPLAWVDTVERSARAVAAVESETGLDLTFGGPATAVPDPTYLVPFVARFRDPSLPLDFVSWHYYGNYPFFGPDGAEFAATEPIQPVVGQRNPLTSPSDYGPQVTFVRQLVETTLAGSGRALPQLVLDEWNLSAAGFDHRHDTAAGAAFAAGVLVELQGAALDAAAFFRANDTRGVPGEHGIVTVDGTPKPVWWTFAFWRDLAATTVAVEPRRAPADHVFTVASRDDHRATVLIAAFDASRSAPSSAAAASPVELRFVGGGLDQTAVATVRRIGGSEPPGEAQAVAVRRGSLLVDLPDPGVVLVDLPLRPEEAPGQTDTVPAGTGGSATAGPSPLPATGASGPLAGAAAAAAAALLLGHLRRSAQAGSGRSARAPSSDR